MVKSRRVFMFIGLLTWVSLLSAQPDPYPTLTALQEADLPPRDRVVLAQALSGVTTIASPPAQPIEYTLGARQTFTVSNSTDDEITRVEAELAAIGQHILIWVDLRAEYDPAEIVALADSFDSFIYPKVRAMWGSEASPGIDGDTRVYALFAYGLGDNVGAYFSSDHSYPSEVVSTSNEHEMFIYNLDAYGDLDSAEVQATTAHEFQHMIRENINLNPDTWVDEGLSVFTEIYIGYPDSALITGVYMAMPFTQLNTWADEGPRAPHYGGAGLFFTYLYERFGASAMQAVSASEAGGLVSVDEALKSQGHEGVDDFFADWVVANIAASPKADDGQWGYHMIEAGRAFHRTVSEYPFVHTDSIPPYSVDYFAVGQLKSDTLHLSLTLPATTRAVPTDAASGQRMWYSHRGDNSVTTLSREFDLTGVTSAELRYKTWYWYEDGWDFGYLMVSTDGAQTWDILSTPHSSTNNPHDTAFGAGYTGESGGWLEESVALDAYAGQRIWVRFASITDDAVTQPGMTLDDVRLDAVGYASDFESDDGGWQAEGWVWIDNILPQKTYVQIIQLLPDDRVQVTRQVLESDSGTWDFILDPKRERTFVAISPVAPVTTESMTYTLTLE